jgi:isocitrate dehydrogenase
MITAVNPAIIKWARERSGLSLDDLARLMKDSKTVKCSEFASAIIENM